jgi:hypothetical protein
VKRLPLLLVGLLAPLAGSPAVAQAPATTAVSAPVAPDPGLQPIDGTEVVARINDQAILACEIMWEVNLILEENQHQIPPEHLEAARQQILDARLRQYIDLRLAYLEFLSKAKNADLKGIRQQMETPFYEGGKSGDAAGSIPGLMKALEVSTHQELETRLLALGTSLGDRRDAFADQIIAMQWMNEKVKVEKPTYADLVEYYQKNRAEFAFPTQVRWEELMVRFDAHPDKPTAREKLVGMGNKAWNRLQATPATPQPLLGDIARQNSEGFNAAEGGLYDWTTRGTLRDANLEATLFALPVGKLSPILESTVGFHILRVIERREAGEKPFLEVQNEIRRKIENERFNEGMRKAVVELRKNVRVWTPRTGEVSAEAFLNPRR